MAERTKLSGAQYLKRKVEIEKGKAKLAGSFLKYLKKDEKVAESNTYQQHKIVETIESSSVSCSHQSQIPENIVQSKENLLHEDSLQQQPNCQVKEGSSESSTVNISSSIVTGTDNDKADKPDNDDVESGANLKSKVNYGDPGTWPKVDAHMRKLLVEHGPDQVKTYYFPKDENKRKFSAHHYERRLANGEVINRTWLQYSISKDSVFCFCCKVFQSKARVSSLSENGSNDWKNITALLSSHEKSINHLDSVEMWRV